MFSSSTLALFKQLLDETTLPDPGSTWTPTWAWRWPTPFVGSTVAYKTL